MMATPQTPPVDVPHIVLHGRTYRLAFDLIAQYVLDKRGVDLGNIYPTLLSDKPGRFALSIDLFAALVANNFNAITERIPTAEDWLAKLTDDEVVAVSKAVGEVMLNRIKATLAAKQTLPTPTASEPEPSVQ